MKKEISQNELSKRIEEHQKWLKDHNTGERLVLVNYDLPRSDLRDSDLHGSDLHGSDLRDSDLRGSDLRGSDLRGSDLHGSDLRGSNLRDSDLRYSDLHYSDLYGSNIDFSSWPIWCGSVGVKIDETIAMQLAYHAMCNMDKKTLQKFLNNPIEFANNSHVTTKHNCEKIKILDD